ncbi:hypothetical protein EW146_g6602 [Bondarzewia mesenterica]|uniref:20S-pre-rRNA D-site endonuclease NOB1 n=1 Tax=Bondarzewia mesenterica TaxID=1095465 RepID=A0A4S4LPY1_9AGAM|nr:hypothetical protein EW146_g6602 [Bondarzewia mesenterica]
MASSSSNPACKHLVLDAGPLLSLSPLRGLAETYVTVPQVLDELKDRRAREHFEKLGLSAGVRVEIRSPDAASLAHVIQFAKKTGDYSVLSTADLAVLALTYALDIQEKKRQAEQSSSEEPNPSATSTAADPSVKDPGLSEETTQDFKEASTVGEQTDTVERSLSKLSLGEQPSDGVPEIERGNVTGEEVTDGPSEEKDMEEREPLDVELCPTKANADLDHSPQKQDEQTIDEPSPSVSDSLAQSQPEPSAPLYNDPSDDDDGEGEWITPSNVGLHKSRALGLTPSVSGSAKGKAKETIPVGCMTADFAMQNVLLQMDLNLVGVEGKKIDRVKTWVLRCHACFKICKDSSKKFCPSCGNPTLLRASVTVSSPNASSNAPAMQVHLKKNFQYRTRGTIYSIPSPKPGSAKSGSGEGLILREDQSEYMRAKKQVDLKRQREEKKMLSGALASGGAGGLNVGNWMDPDWIPDIISAGASGKGRNPRGRTDMPVIGYGRKNPNERKHHK